MQPKRFYRSFSDRKVAGIAAGLGEYFEYDPLLFRLLFIVFTPAGGVGLFVYIILWIVTPDAPFEPKENFSGNPENYAEGFSADEQKNSTSQEYQTYRPAPTPPKRPAAHAREKKQRGSLVWGMVLITLGGLIMVDNLLPSMNFWDLWPVILIVLGVAILINTMIKRTLATSHESIP